MRTVIYWPYLPVGPLCLAVLVGDQGHKHLAAGHGEVERVLPVNPCLYLMHILVGAIHYINYS